jgi:hypothetical protein
MAIIFNGTSSTLRTLTLGAARPSAYSVACWVKFTLAVSGAKIEIIAAAGNSLGLPSDSGDIALGWSHTTAAFRNRATIHTTGSTYVATNTQGSTATATWVHRAAVYTGSNLLFYENGAQIGSSAFATVTAAAPLDWFFSLGCNVDNALFAACKAMMAGYWDIGLSAADVAALAAGFPPENIRPQSLQAYFPGLRDAKNYRGTGWTEANLTFDNDSPKLML